MWSAAYNNTTLRTPQLAPGSGKDFYLVISGKGRARTVIARNQITEDLLTSNGLEYLVHVESGKQTLELVQELVQSMFPDFNISRSLKSSGHRYHSDGTVAISSGKLWYAHLLYKDESGTRQRIEGLGRTRTQAHRQVIKAYSQII